MANKRKRTRIVASPDVIEEAAATAASIMRGKDGPDGEVAFSQAESAIRAMFPNMSKDTQSFALGVACGRLQERARVLNGVIAFASANPEGMAPQ